MPNCVKEPIKIEDEVIHETDKSLVIWPKDYAFGFTKQFFYFFFKLFRGVGVGRE